MNDTPQTDPTAYVEVLARLLCAADVHVHGDEHPTWQHLVGETGSRIRDDYRAAARWLAARLTVAPAVVSSPPATDRATVRDRVAEALHAHLARTADIRLTRGGEYAFMPEITDPERMRITDAVLAVLPPPADRAAVLLEVADWLKAWRPEFFERWAVVEQDRYEGGVDDAAAELRRMADEAQQSEGECPQCGDAGACAGGPCPLLPAVGARQPDTETQDPGACGHRSSDGHPCNEPPGHLGFHRNARQGGHEWTSWVGDGLLVESEEMCSAEPPDGWPGDCWCTLPDGHEGPHRCEPCSNRHDAPGWSDDPAFVYINSVTGQGDKQETQTVTAEIAVSLASLREALALLSNDRSREDLRGSDAAGAQTKLTGQRAVIVPA